MNRISQFICPLNRQLIFRYKTSQNNVRLEIKRNASNQVVPIRQKRIPKPNLNLSKDKEVGGLGWFLFLIPVSAFALGTWQVKRKKWKEGLIESLMYKTKEPPVPLPEDDSEIADLEFRRVAVKGEFDHSQEMFIGPRSLLIDGESAYHGQLMSTSSNNTSGFNVVTPFILSDTKEKILVNRGWIPYPMKNAKTRLAGQVEGEIELVGVVRSTENRPPFGSPNKLDVRVWFYRDVEKMARIVGSRPVFIDATSDSSVPGGPVGGQTRASIRNEHFSYIITWYSLSAATALMWYFKYFK